jgi:predicted MFS family arabinose efflux permease
MKKILADYILDLRLIQKNVRLFLVGGLLMGVLSAFIQLLLNLYLKQIGYQEGFIGRVLSLGSFGAMTAALPAVYLAARFKIKPILLLTIVLMSVAYFVLSLSPWSSLILIAAFVGGLLMAVKNVVSAPFLMRNSTERERTLIFALNFSTWIVSGIFGSLGGGWLHDVYLRMTGSDVKSYQYAMITAVVIGMLALIPFSLIKSPEPRPDDISRIFSWSALKAKRRLFFKLTFPYLLVGAGAGLIIPFLNLYFRNRFHLEPARIGVYFAVLQCAMLVAVLIVPIMKRHLGYIKTVVLTELLSVPFMLILCYSNNLNLAFMAFIFRGALMNMGVPVTNTFMMESVDDCDHGLINSLSAIGWSGAWAVSTQIGGLMIEKGGFVGVFLAAIALYVISAGLYYYFFSDSETREGERIIIDTGSPR